MQCLVFRISEAQLQWQYQVCLCITRCTSSGNYRSCSANHENSPSLQIVKIAFNYSAMGNFRGEHETQFCRPRKESVDSVMIISKA